MVGHGNGLELALTEQLFKPVVAQLACRHLHREVALLDALHRVETDGVEGHLQVAAKLAYKPLVALRLLASQLEVAMGRLAAVA